MMMTMLTMAMMIVVVMMMIMMMINNNSSVALAVHVNILRSISISSFFRLWVRIQISECLFPETNFTNNSAHFGSHDLLLVVASEKG